MKLLTILKAIIKYWPYVMDIIELIIEMIQELAEKSGQKHISQLRAESVKNLLKDVKNETVQKK